MKFVLRAQTVNLLMRARTYDTPEGSYPEKDSASIFQPNGPIQIEKPTLYTVLRPPKGVLRRSMHNPNARAAHN